MEPKKARTWVWVVIGVCAGLVACCGLALVGAIGVPVIWHSISDAGWRQAKVTRPAEEWTERVEETFEVGRAPELEVDSFAGRVTIHAGDDGSVLGRSDQAHTRGSRPRGGHLEDEC